ncbi:MAG: 4Fe-4S binding protein [Candidatus Eremiobacteraeota bacterium]|nr:4Fe-4S binding protein [Candidatus Eremiobacteraeota bacterium]MCL5055739.1 4Fe-4S binding protein [Bacillota bacterium]
MESTKTYIREVPYLKKAHQTGMPKLPAEYRIHNWEEVELGFTDDLAVAEGKRCFSCEVESCIACGVCVEVCPVGIIYLKGEPNAKQVEWPKEYVIDVGLCMFCGLCVERCPTQSLYMTHDYEVSTEIKANFMYPKEKLERETKSGKWSPSEKEINLETINPFQKPPRSLYPQSPVKPES